MILAPLRGVTISCFRKIFREIIYEAGFTEVLTPFVPALSGFDPMADRELHAIIGAPFKITPQFIGKDPMAFKVCLGRIKAVGYDMADLNCGCPFPMVRNKGRGSGLLRTPDVLRQMIEVGCEVMGEGHFSIKARLGIDRNDELLELMPMINQYPLRFLTVHARTARQMYEGTCDQESFLKVAKVAKVPVVYNGDVDFPCHKGFPVCVHSVMIGRNFVRWLGNRKDIGELLNRYIEASCAELCGERPVLGRIKELTAYWKDIPQWRRCWPILKCTRSLGELKEALGFSLVNNVQR